jgi:hypothetical protein
MFQIIGNIPTSLFCIELLVAFFAPLTPFLKEEKSAAQEKDKEIFRADPMFGKIHIIFIPGPRWSSMALKIP